VTITAKDVQNLRQATGVGMMDAKRALEANNGDMEASVQWLRVQGLASAAKRADRDASEGAVAVVRDGNVAAIVELRCETDFVAKSQEFVALADEIAARVVADGDQSIVHFKENITQFPRVELLSAPTAIHRLFRIEEALGTSPGDVRLFAKRDDVMALGGGGNKLRKLEFLLGDARRQGADTFITVGGRQSNHARLTAAAATSAPVPGSRAGSAGPAWTAGSRWRSHRTSRSAERSGCC